MTASNLIISPVLHHEMELNKMKKKMKQKSIKIDKLYIELGNKNKVIAKSNSLLWEMIIMYNVHVWVVVQFPYDCYHLINEMEISRKNISVYFSVSLIITMITTICLYTVLASRNCSTAQATPIHMEDASIYFHQVS